MKYIGPFLRMNSLNQSKVNNQLFYFAKESLKQVDDKMVIINNFLDDVEDDKEIDK